MRYLPLTDDERSLMMKDIGISSLDELFSNVPKLETLPINLPKAMDEMALQKYLSSMAAENMIAADVPCFLGAGAYRHYVPAIVDYLLSRGEFLTSYTPYQPEVSQGTLQILFEFQTQVARLTGMDIANASLYDGASACFEAATMAVRVTKRKKVILSGTLHPEIRQVVKSCSQFSGIECELKPPVINELEDFTIDENTACVIVQVPSFFGSINDFTTLAEKVHAKGALLVISFMEPLALALIKSLGDMGADIVAGEGASLAGHLNFGGPTLGLFAVRKELMRNMPGRLIGETKDVDGRRGFVLTMATREQHIRREKATSNICTNAGLMAAAFSMRLAMLGEKALVELAELNHAKAVSLADRIAKIDGIEVLNSTFFNEFTLKLTSSAKDAVQVMADKGVLGGVPVSRFYPDRDDLLLIAVTETVSDDDCDKLLECLKELGK